MEAYMNKPTIKATVNGPYEVDAGITVIDAKGGIHESTGEKMHLCRCGQSKNKPFCDGSHAKCGFKDPV